MHEIALGLVIDGLYALGAGSAAGWLRASPRFLPIERCVSADINSKLAETDVVMLEVGEHLIGRSPHFENFVTDALASLRWQGRRLSDTIIGARAPK